MSINRKIIIIIGAVVFLAMAALITALSLGNRTKSVKIGFYDLDPATEDLFVQLVRGSYEEDKKAPDISFEHLDQTDASVDMILMPMGKIQDNLISTINTAKKNNPSLESSVLNNTTTSVRQKAIQMDGNVISIPLLMDNVELELSNDAIAMTNTKQLQTWKDIEAFAATSQTYFPYPIVFAGADSVTLLNVITTLTEAYSGKEAYQKAVDELSSFFDGKDYIPDASEINELLQTIAASPESPLYAATSTLARWIDSGLLTANVFNMTKRDVEIYMESHYCSVAITTLSDHRNMPTQAVKSFTTLPRALGNGGNSVGFFPSSRPASQRHLTGSVISAVPLSKNKFLPNLVKTMLSSGFQADLAFGSGLAPVDAQCQPPDILSDDVRFFVAATNAPLTPLDQAVFSNEKAMEAFVQELKTFIKVMRK